MSRILVVSRNTSVAMALASDDHDVIDRRPDAAESWRGELPGVEAALFDFEGSLTAAAIIKGLRREGFRLPMVLTRDGEAGWDELQGSGLPSVGFVRVPLFRRTLIEAVRAALLARPPPADAFAPTPPAPAAPEPEAVHAGQPSRPPRSPLSVSTSTVSRGVQLVPPPARVTTQTRPAPPPPTPSPSVPPRAPSVPLVPPAAPVSPPLPSPQRAQTPAPDRAARRPAAMPRLSSKPAVAEKRRKQTVFPARPTSPAGDREHLVRRLLNHLESLAGVQETAEVVLAESQERSGAEAGCVLLPDGDLCQVSAGAGMRQLENRLRLDAGHWLVEEVIGRQHGLLVTDSDIARSRMAGAPLAHWRHLLGVPIGEVGGLILLAREKAPFSERDLRAVADVADEAGPLLSSALDLRQLARALVEYAEED